MHHPCVGVMFCPSIQFISKEGKDINLADTGYIPKSYEWLSPTDCKTLDLIFLNCGTLLMHNFTDTRPLGTETYWESGIRGVHGGAVVFEVVGTCGRGQGHLRGRDKVRGLPQMCAHCFQYICHWESLRSCACCWSVGWFGEHHQGCHSSLPCRLYFVCEYIHQASCRVIDLCAHSFA